MSGLIDKARVADSFSRAAASYDSVAALQRSVGEALLSRVPSLDYCSGVDLGCGTGYFSQRLMQQYSISELYCVDIAEGMLQFARRERGVSSMYWLCGDAESLPLSDNSIDLMFSSLAIQWCEDVPKLFAEIERVLKPGGRMLFATLGPDTLKELRGAWREVDGMVHVNRFTPLAELQAGLAGLEIEELSTEYRMLEYRQLKELTDELKGLGAHNINAGRQVGLTGRARVRRFKEAYEAFRLPSGLLPATYEVYYGVVRKPVAGI